MESIFVVSSVIAMIIAAAVVDYLWYRRARRKRHAERLQWVIMEAHRDLRQFALSPRDVAQLREMVEEAHKSHHA